MFNTTLYLDTNISILHPDIKFTAETINRSCNGCTKCCDGWLTGNIYGYPMYENQPCRFSLKGSGCAIYPNRPLSPCKTFKCAWKINLNIPEEYKPDKSNVIMIYRQLDDLEFLDVIRAGPNPNKEVIEFAVKMYEQKKVESVRFLFDDSNLKYLSTNKNFLDYVNRTGKYADL